MKEKNKTKLREKYNLIRQIYNLRLPVAISLTILNPFGTNKEKPETKPYHTPRYEIISVEYYNNFGQVKEPVDFKLSPFFQELVNQRANSILSNLYDKGVYEWSRSVFSQYDDYAERAGIDRDLLESLVLIESRADPKARSPTGPKGLGQFARETAIRNGAYISDFIDQRYDPEITLTKLIPNNLNEILQKYRDIGIYNVSLEQALYTYNKGELTSLDGEDLYNTLSDTLQYYIREIGALRELIKNDSLKCELMPLYSERIEKADIHIFRPNDSLGRIAFLNNTSSRRIIELNPQLKDYNKIPKGYPLRIPKEL